MQRYIYFFMIFALSLAADVSVYNVSDIYAEPVIESAFPWKFEFGWSDQFYMTLLYRNKAPSVTTMLPIFGPRLKSFWTSNGTLPTVKNAPVNVAQFFGTEATIDLDLNTSNGLCTKIRIAEGRIRSEKTDNEYKYADICFKGADKPCVLVVDLKDFKCEGTLAERKVNTTTARLAADFTTTNKANAHDISSFVFIILMVSVFLSDHLVL